MADWIAVCDLDDIDPEDVLRFDHDGRTFAIYRPASLLPPTGCAATSRCICATVW